MSVTLACEVTFNILWHAVKALSTFVHAHHYKITTRKMWGCWIWKSLMPHDPTDQTTSLIPDYLRLCGEIGISLGHVLQSHMCMHLGYSYTFASVVTKRFSVRVPERPNLWTNCLMKMKFTVPFELSAISSTKCKIDWCLLFIAECDASIEVIHLY